jgi:hypothetical protein
MAKPQCQNNTDDFTTMSRNRRDGSTFGEKDAELIAQSIGL